MGKAIEVASSVPSFGRVSFAWPKYDTVYPDARGGGKSYKLLTFACPLPGCGLTVDGSIYAKMNASGDISAAASLPKALSGSKESSDAFLGHVETAAMKWADWTAAWEASKAALRGEKKTTKGAAARPTMGDVPVKDMSPRLVKHETVSTEAPPSVQ